MAILNSLSNPILAGEPEKLKKAKQAKLNERAESDTKILALVNLYKNRKNSLIDRE